MAGKPAAREMSTRRFSSAGPVRRAATGRAVVLVFGASAPPFPENRTEKLTHLRKVSDLEILKDVPRP